MLTWKLETTTGGNQVKNATIVGTLLRLSENVFSYSQQKIQAKEFTMTFKFNFTDIEFLLTKSKVLELSDVPRIIQKI